MRFSAAFGRFVTRWRIAIVAFWISVAVLGSVLLPNVEQANTGTLGDLVPTNAAAIDTEIRSVELFSFPVLSRTVVVERKRDGLSREEAADVYMRAAALGLGDLAGLESIPFALAVTNDLLGDVVSGGATSSLTYLFFPPEIGPVGRTGLAERFLERYVNTPGLQTGVTGAVPARGEQIRSIRDALPLVELVTLLIITLAVGLYARSLVAPLINVLTVGLAYVTAVRLIGGIGQGVGISVPEEVEPVMVALLFGIVTDYVIFFLDRFRRELAEGATAPEAAAQVTEKLVPIIFTAGISVAAASAALVVAQLGFFQAFGPGLAVAVLISLAVVLTLVPALLAMLGRAVYWPGSLREGRPRQPDATARASRRRLRRFRGGLRGARASMLRFPVDRPVVAVIITGIPLLALSAATLHLSLANTLISGLPVDSPPKQAFRLAAKDFPPGAISPTMILVEGSEVQQQTAALRSLENLLAARLNVSDVVGPASVAEPTDLGATISPTGGAVRYLLVLDVDPLGARAIRTVGRLRNDLPQMLESAGLEGATASLAGDTALSEETVRKTRSDLGRIVPVSALLVTLILCVFLRALIAPLYLVFASLLALAASLGLTILVFQDLLGYSELTFYVPFAGIVLLIALGSDYNVYLAGRVWAEARERPLREAVAVAGAKAASAITVAGLVLAISFAVLALVPLRPFRELAFLLSTGLIIDAFVVRSLLAPALITLFGERGGWPGGALRGTAAGPERIEGEVSQ